MRESDHEKALANEIKDQVLAILRKLESINGALGWSALPGEGALE